MRSEEGCKSGKEQRCGPNWRRKESKIKGQRYARCSTVCGRKRGYSWIH